MTWLRKGADERGSFARIVEAAGLSRQVQHLMDGPFGILSASRGELPAEQNAKRTRELREMIRTDGYGYIPALGVWDGVGEDSMLVPNVSKEKVREWAAHFGQDAYVMGEGGAYAVLATSDDAVIEEGNVKDRWQYLGKGEDAEDANAYTEVDDRRWRFKPLSPQAATGALYAFETKQGHRWAFKAEQPPLGGGRPYFFVVDANLKYASPRFGFGSLKDGHPHLDAKWLSVFLLIPEVKPAH